MQTTELTHPVLGIMDKWPYVNPLGMTAVILPTAKASTEAYE